LEECAKATPQGLGLVLAAVLSASKENNVSSHLVVLLIVVLSLGAAPAAAGESPPTLRQLKQAVAANPQDPQAYYALGEKYESQGQLQQARQEYQTALSLKPDDAQGLYRMGRLMGKLGELEPAIKIIKEAVRLNPELAEARSLLAAAYNQQGMTLMRQGSLDAAQEALEAGLQARGGPAVTEALGNNLGCLYIRQDRLDQAIATFQEVLRQNPDVAQARYNLALIYYTQGDYQAASQEFFALKGIDPDLATELSNYRFRIKTSTDYAPPVKTIVTFKGNQLLIEGSIPPDFRP
jgi:tetratricopeptide (TPR) repeat protein